MSNKINNKGDNNISLIADRDINITHQIPPVPINKFVELITIIGETMDDLSVNHVLTEPPDIKSKIEFNGLIEIEPIIKDYSLHINTIEETKKLLEGNPCTHLYWVKTSDIIINKYRDLVNENKNSTPSQIWYELKNYILKCNNISDSVLERVLDIIMVALFVRCKIFKNEEQTDPQ